MYSLKYLCDHKTSHRCQFVEMEIYVSSASWKYKHSIDLWFIRMREYLAEIQLKKKMQKNNIEEIAFKVVLIKSLAYY